MPGETSNNQSNFNKQEVSLYAHLYEKYVEIKNVDGTVEITPDKYNWHNGGVVLEYVDCRPQPTCSGKRILLRQNTASLWDDVLRINQDAGGTLTQEMAIQVESQLLLAMNPTIDLDPSSTLQGMKRYDLADGPVEPVHRELKTRKRKLNSYELEQEAAKKARKEQMMFMMDERHGREFKPTFKLLPYFKGNRNKVSTVGKGKQRSDAEAEQGRGSAKKSGRKLVRQLRFERSFTDASDKTCKLFTSLNIYQDVNGQHEAICYSISEKDLRSEGKYNSFMQTINEGKECKLDDGRAKFRNELGNTEAYKSFIKSFVVLYSIDNNLKFDSAERVDKVPVEMLTEVTTELTSPQTEMKFDNMPPYEIIELLCQQSDTETTNSNEGARDLSVSDLYNAAAKKALQAKPSVSAPVNQDQSLMSPPQRRRNSQRPRQASTTQAQAPTSNPQFLMQTGNQTPTQQQISQAQIQPQVMAASQSPSQRPIQSPALIQQNFPGQVPQSSTDGTRPIQQIPIAGVPIQLSNAQMPLQQVQLMQGQIGGQPNVRQGRPLGPVRIVQGIPSLTHVTHVNARPVTNQNVVQGTTIQNTITSPSMQKGIPIRRTAQGQSQQMNVPAQQMNISPQANSSQMNQVPQINIPTQPTDPRVTQLNIQNQINQVQSAAQINIPTQVTDQINLQQTQTTPRINPGRVTPQMNSRQARSTPQINIPVQVSDMQTTPRINPAQVPQVNADQMNVHILQMNQRRMMQQTDQNISPQRNNVNRPQGLNIQQQQQQQILQQQLAAAMTRIPGINTQQLRANGFIRHPVMNMQGSMQQPFMQMGIPIQGQLLSGQQQNGIRPQARPQFIPIFMRQNMANMANMPMIQQQLAAQQLGVQMNGGGQWIFQQNQNQPLQQPPNPQSPWNTNGNASGKQ